MNVSKHTVFYISAILLGILAGLSGNSVLEQTGHVISEMFIRMFKCISMPIIALSVIVALSSYESENKSMSLMWKRTLLYTLSTTIIATVVAAIIYYIVSPNNISVISPQVQPIEITKDVNYIKYFLEIVPDSIFSAFLEQKVLSLLLISVIFGIAIRFIKEVESKNSVISFFKGIHSIFFTITKFIVSILPIGLFGFITVSAFELRHGMDLKGMGGYLMVIILSNILHGIIILPILLVLKRQKPIKNFKAMLPAISVAFFSKSSTSILPVTMETAEEQLGITQKTSRFVLPLCTTINVNGCAIFVFTTVIYIMQNNGIEISMTTLMSWILISTIAATGNAGVPMGCFFLSASLLSSMNIPMSLMGLILPFYGIIDMFEASLNVWSDSCIASIVDKEVG